MFGLYGVAKKVEVLEVTPPPSVLKACEERPKAKAAKDAKETAKTQKQVHSIAKTLKFFWTPIFTSLSPLNSCINSPPTQAHQALQRYSDKTWFSACVN